MKTTRRDLFRYASPPPCRIAAAAGQSSPAANQQTMIGVRFDAKPTVRMGFIGLGGRGMSQLQNFTAVDGVEVVALCDVAPEKTARAQQRLQKAGQQKAAEVYHGSETAFESLSKREDIDLVCIATPWKWHVPMAVMSLRHGQHACV